MFKFIRAAVAAVVVGSGAFLLTAESPVVDPVKVTVDCQAHWFDVTQGGHAQHLHVGAVDIDPYKPVTGPFDVLIRTQAFHTDAVPFDFSVSGPGASSGSEVSRTVVPEGGNTFGVHGDPNGLVVATAISRQDPALWDPRAHNGGAPVSFTYQARTSNNSEIRAVLTLPTIAAVNTSIPVNPEWPMECWGWTHSGRTPQEIGSLLISFAQGDRQAPTGISRWPTTPISEYQTVRVQVGRYGPPGFAQYLVGEGFVEQRLNPVLHAGDPGILVQRIEKDFTNDNNTYMDVVLDPAQMHEGVNTVMIRGSVEIPEVPGLFPGGETQQVLLTLTVVKGDPGAPPVDTDGDGVPDSVDACPTQVGPAPTGCPVQQPPSWQKAAALAAINQAIAAANTAPEPLKSTLLGLLQAALAAANGG